MAWLTICALALFVSAGVSDPIKKATPKIADPVLLQHQLDLMTLYFHIHEPNHVESCKAISSTWNLQKNIQHYSNVTALNTYIEMMQHKWLLPKGLPFNIHVHEHKFEAITLFNVLFSAKDYDTFYKTAVYLREHVNEHLFSYILNVVVIHRKDTQGIITPNLYEVLPSFFNNGEIMNTAQRINTHGFQNIEYYPSTYKWDENIVIQWNDTIWPYTSCNSENPTFYFTHDYGLNTAYYNYHVAQPSWLGGDLVPLVKDRRGEWFWYLHKELLARYYMERLSNGLGEIPELGHEIVEHGYASGLLYHNGIPFPVRSNYFHLDSPEFVDEMQEINDYEHRIREAIQKGHIIGHSDEHIDLKTPETIDVLGRVIEANVDSPNVHYYKDFISIWKKVLGNSLSHEQQYYNNYIPLVVPSVLEHYQTTLRDPAFYMIWKRVLGLFQLWQEQLPLYKHEELAFPQVTIQKVEVNKLVTYFVNTYINVTNHLHTTTGQTDTSVLVQHPRLNHKVFKVRVNVKSEAAKTVVVKFFLAPKYDSHNNEIPLHVNSHNVYMFDEFIYDLPAGDCVITRSSDDNQNLGQDFTSTFEIYNEVQKALQGKGQFIIDQSTDSIKLPHRLLLPKGHTGGMPFVFIVYISEYHKPNPAYGTEFDPTSKGIGAGALRITKDPLGFPFNRPVHSWQAEHLTNLFCEDVLIYHKHTPEIHIAHTE